MRIMDSGRTTIHEGMGPIPHPRGTAFRVWTPFASKVFIAGDFNGWSETANPMNSERHGYWYADIPEAKIGHKYKYVIIILCDIQYTNEILYCN